MASGSVNLSGKVINAAGADKVGLTVELYQAATWEAGGAATATDTTDSDGLWNFDAQDISKTWIVCVIDGTKKYLIDARNDLQLSELDLITSLNVNTIYEHTAASGVTIDGVLLKDSGIQFQDDTLKVENPAATFAYTIQGAAIAANRTLNLPLITGTDTLAVLALAQTFLTGVKTFNSSILAVRNPGDTFSYTIVASAILAARNLTIPLLTADDTIAVLGLAQTFTGGQTITANAGLTINSAEATPLAKWVLDIQDGGATKDLAVLTGTVANSSHAWSAPYVIYQKARGNIGTPTAISSGDHIAQVSFRGHDGVGYQIASSMEVLAAENFGVANWGTEIRLRTTPLASVTIQTTLSVKDVLLTSRAPIVFSTGVAVTAAAYWTGKNADATPVFQVNVPTGAGMEWSINDVSKLAMDANGHLSIGGAPVLGTLLDLSGTYTATADQPQHLYVSGTITTPSGGYSSYGMRLLTNVTSGGGTQALFQGGVISNGLTGTWTTAEGLRVDAPSGGTVTNRFAAKFGGIVVPEADGTRSLGLAALRWSDVRSVLINGADYGFENKWRLLEADRYKDYGEGIALDVSRSFVEDIAGPTNPASKPLFVITEDFIEYKGRRITTQMLDTLERIS